MKRIGFVGGPLSGKTSLINELAERLKSKGYKVIIMEEIPTKLLKMGLIPDDNISRLDFQKECLVQYFIEYLKLNYLNDTYYQEDKDKDKYIVLYDTLPGCGLGYINNKNEYSELEKMIYDLKRVYQSVDFEMDEIIFCNTIKTDNFSDGNSVRVEKDYETIDKISNKINKMYKKEITISLNDIGLENRLSKVLEII